MNTRSSHACNFSLLLVSLLFSFLVKAQAVTGIITDYKGFWKTSSSSINPTKPDNSHNLLAFTYNGVQYSTGVNNELLSGHGESFVAADFWSLPVESISGTIGSNTKIGLGALYDEVYNGPSNPAPVNDIPKYLTDGIKGLDLGTCVANLPTGTLSFFVSNLSASAIGDGIPDIIVTQIADPTGSSYDRYEFIDQNGARVGNYKDIVFTSIVPIANWVADFYEAKNDPMTLIGGFTQTERPIRLWAADLSEFGVTSSNLSSIKSFRINLCGNSDVAFVAYNNQSIRMTNVLPQTLLQFKGSATGQQARISWQLKSDVSGELSVLEKSRDGNVYVAVDSFYSLKEKTDYYTLDKTPYKSTNYYRLKMVNQDGQISYSNIIQLNFSSNISLSVYPNPAKNFVVVQHSAATERTSLSLYTSSGILIKTQLCLRESQQAKFDLSRMQAGTYYLVYKTAINSQTQAVIIQ